jgi:hypothetical protein
MEIPSESSSGSEKIKGRRKDKFQADVISSVGCIGGYQMGKESLTKYVSVPEIDLVG